MKNANDMTMEQMAHWADKTVKSIQASALRGNIPSRKGAGELVERFDELKKAMRECGIWKKYCADRGYDKRLTSGKSLYVETIEQYVI